MLIPHVILIAGDDPGAQSPERLHEIRAAVTDANVLLVAPALPVSGERWIIDLDARASQARSRLQRWAAALADDASAVEATVGDADPRQAAVDARREFPAARIVDAPAEEPERFTAPRRLMRLIGRYGFVPAPVAAGR